ncbi:MAG: 7-cyano-7-deazaguanine synthase [Nanoarchaeota archaeon]
MGKKKQAIILCSGGLDSTVTAYHVKSLKKYNKIIILFFNYNQKSLIQERKFSKLTARSLNADFIEIKLNELNKISTSLINIKGKTQKVGKADLKDTKKESKKWYVPCRNLIFISYALAFADSSFMKYKNSSDIFLGFKCEGNDSYPDTTQDFVNQMNKLSKLSTESKSKILVPLIKMDKEDIINLGKKLNVNFKKTFSCYSPRNNIHCGICLACALRKYGFYWSGIKDPTSYTRQESS